MWVEFVVGFRLAPRVFLRVHQFSFLHKNQHLQIPFDQDEGPAWKPAKAYVASPLDMVNPKRKQKATGNSSLFPDSISVRPK